MEGKIILAVRPDQPGIIRGSDGQRYYYQFSDWLSELPAKVGDQVDFECIENQAREICRLNSAPAQPAAGRFKEKINMDQVQTRARDIFQQTLSKTEDLKSIKNVPGIAISTVFLIALMFPLFNIKVLGMSMGMHQEYDPTNNTLMTFIILVGLASIILFALDLKPLYSKIASLMLLILFVGLTVTAFSSIAEVNQASREVYDSASELLGSTQMQQAREMVDPTIKVIPQLGYYLAAMALLGQLYFVFVYKRTQ